MSTPPINIFGLLSNVFFYQNVIPDSKVIQFVNLHRGKSVVIIPGLSNSSHSAILSFVGDALHIACILPDDGYVRIAAIEHLLKRICFTFYHYIFPSFPCVRHSLSCRDLVR